MLPEEEFPEEEVANVAGAAEVLIMTPLARLGLLVRSWEDVDLDAEMYDRLKVFNISAEIYLP